MKNRVVDAMWKPSKRFRWRRMKPFGLVVHTSGRGIVARAKRRGVDPIDLALEWYRSKGSVHFVIDYDGTLYQLLDANKRGAHIGIARSERRAFLNGSWANSVPVGALRRWVTQWTGVKSPQHLYPTKSPNACYVGVEMLPLARARDNGLWFTPAQHDTALRLYRHLAVMYRWPLSTIALPNKRFLGHEDIDAFARWQESGGWDPGAMRDNPRFCWDTLQRG